MLGVTKTKLFTTTKQLGHEGQMIFILINISNKVDTYDTQCIIGKECTLFKTESVKKLDISGISLN